MSTSKGSPGSPTALASQLQTLSISQVLVNKMKQIRQSFKDGPKMPIIASFGHQFPIVGRKPLSNALYQAVANRELNNNDKQAHPILHISTGPGMGKSAILNQFKKILLLGKGEMEPLPGTAGTLDFESACEVVFSYNAGTCVHQSEIGKESYLESFAKRLLFRHFMSGKACAFGDFLHATQELKVDVPNALRAIAEDSGSNIILLGIDEYNRLLDDPDPVRKSCFKRIVEELAAFQASYGMYNIFLVTLFAGTAGQDLSEVFSGSFAIPELLPLPLLTFDESYTLLLALMKKPGFKTLHTAMTTQNAKVVRCLHLLAGHPRAIEQWLIAICQNPTFSLENSIVSAFTMLKKMYRPLSINPVPIIAVSIFEIPVKPTTVLIPGLTVAALSEKGQLMIEDAPTLLERRVLVRLPSYWLFLHAGEVESLELLVEKIIKTEIAGIEFETINFFYRRALMHLLRIVASDFSSTSWGQEILSKAEQNVLDLLYKDAITDGISVPMLPKDLMNFAATEQSMLPFQFGSTKNPYPGKCPGIKLNRTCGEAIDMVAWLLPNVVVLEQHKNCDSNNRKYKVNAKSLKQFDADMRSVAGSSEHFEGDVKFITAVVTNKYLRKVTNHETGFPSIVVSGGSRSFGPFSPIINQAKIDMCLCSQIEAANLKDIGEQKSGLVVSERPKNMSELVTKVLAPSLKGSALQGRITKAENALGQLVFFSADFLLKHSWLEDEKHINFL